LEALKDQSDIGPAMQYCLQQKADLQRGVGKLQNKMEGLGGQEDVGQHWKLILSRNV